ncbi:MAG: tetratricopeptide repeat protein [Proteobacteria bacterium]|nr:tetratricopeptide repeat protein [Pseudomonadota bacterium]MBU1585226.1 tetratricopeptide repeat protein [Pseudomonadota bacterium]MBU2431871.1 tetratricopeptide repeat protein [Pseudomonadota bacterium]MBU2454539.1 tetratricopeptide repeat protein [Pseudomonadota bacterium]MBU2629116.1 tetratricopeptide repeat protein [Pseudomonadota bacterium]
MKNFIIMIILSFILPVPMMAQERPLTAVVWINQAITQYEKDDFADAALSFEKGYDLSGIKNPDHLYYAAVCHVQAQAPENALAIFNRLIKAHPDHITLSFKETLVNILFSLERYKDALPYLEQLAEKSGKDQQKNWQEILLYQYFSLGMNDKALAYAGFLTKTDMLESKWWKALCHIHLNNQDYEKGLTALIIYGYLTPMTQEELRLTADLYLTLGISAKAEQIYEQIKAQ